MRIRNYTVAEFSRVFLRRRWWILAPFAVGLAAAPVLAKFAPERYRSETLILVVPQRVPDAYVKATVTQSVEDRLPAITEQILSRSRLERIILDMDLYREARSNHVMEDVVARMRLDVDVGLSGPRGRADSFRVSYVADQPEVARKVTERLASLYIEQNTTDRETQAESTSQFLGTQLEDAKRRLIEQEQKLEEYKRRNAGQLPSQLQGNLQAIQNTNLQLQSLNESTNRAQERRLLIERQVADLRSLPAPVVQSGTSAPEPPAATTTAQQLAAAKARLTSYLQRYRPNHPEVIAEQRLVAELSAKLDGETPLASTGVPSSEQLLMTPGEASQRKKLSDLEAELAVIDHQLAANRVEEERLRRTVADYQAKVDAVPTRESELVELTRDYSTLQAAYSSLLTKREESMIAANLERRQIGEQFRILDPASRPERPYNETERLMVTLSGAVVGFFLGLLLIVAAEFRDTSFRAEDEVQRALSLPVLAQIPVIMSDREGRLFRRRVLMKDVAGSALLLAAVAVIVYWRLAA